MNFKSFATAALIGLAWSAAFADDQTIVLTPTAPGAFSGAFSSSQTTSGLFVDTFTFTLPSAFDNVLGSGTLTFASLSGPASLVVASLDAAKGAVAVSPPGLDTIAFPSMLSFVNASGPLMLTVLGFVGDPFSSPIAASSRYSGTLTFNTASVGAVPEPETLALMLAGL